MTTIREKMEWVGTIAVVASLLLVAYEIRQNTDATAAQAIYDLNGMGNELLRMETDPEFGRLVNAGNRNPDDLDEDEWFRYQRYVWLNLNLYETAWGYYERGLLDESMSEAMPVEYCWKAGQPGFKRAIPTLINWRDSAFLRMAELWCEPETR